MKWSYNFYFYFVNVVHHIDLFVYVYPVLHPWNNLTWSWCLIFLMYCWIEFGNICWRLLHLLFKDWPVICFFCGILIYYLYQSNVGFKICLEVFPSLLFFGRFLERFVIILFWMFCWIYQWIYLVLDLFFWKVQIADSIYFLVISLV